jgi:hypothetical protein
LIKRGRSNVPPLEEKTAGQPTVSSINTSLIIHCAIEGEE